MRKSSRIRRKVVLCFLSFHAGISSGPLRLADPPSEGRPCGACRLPARGVPPAADIHADLLEACQHLRHQKKTCSLSEWEWLPGHSHSVFVEQVFFPKLREEAAGISCPDDEPPGNHPDRMTNRLEISPAGIPQWPWLPASRRFRPEPRGSGLYACRRRRRILFSMWHISSDRS